MSQSMLHDANTQTAAEYVYTHTEKRRNQPTLPYGKYGLNHFPQILVPQQDRERQSHQNQQDCDLSYHFFRFILLFFFHCHILVKFIVYHKIRGLSSLMCKMCEQNGERFS